MKRILITGATGYIGRRVVEMLSHERDIVVLTLNRDVDKASALMPYSNVRHVEACDWPTVVDFCPDVVLHLATFSTSADSTDIIPRLIDSNVTYGAELLDALQRCAGANNMLFINVGSFAEYRLGLDAGQRDAYLYTATKSAFRHILDYYADKVGFRYITAVPYTVYGGRDTGKKLIDYVVESISADQPVDMTLGEQVLDFVHVTDVARFFATAALRPDETEDRHEYHLGTSRGTTVRQLSDAVSRISGRKTNINWGGRPYRPLDVMHAVAPADEVRDKIWTAQITLDQGIKEKLNSI